MFRNGFVPFVRVCEHRIDIEDHAPKLEQAMFYDLTDLKSCLTPVDGVLKRMCIIVRVFPFNPGVIPGREVGLLGPLAAPEKGCQPFSYSTCMAHHNPM